LVFIFPCAESPEYRGQGAAMGTGMILAISFSLLGKHPFHREGVLFCLLEVLLADA
jgi:hypothetical protein